MAPEPVFLLRQVSDPLPRRSIQEMIHGIERVIVHGTEGPGHAVRFPVFQLEAEDYVALHVVLEFLVKLNAIRAKLADLLRREKLL